MKRSTKVGGLTALVAIIATAIICVWLGKSIYDRFSTQLPTTGPTRSELGRKLPPRPTDARSAQEIYLAFGNPSNATADVSNRDNYLIVTMAYALSYNADKGTPNWVAWRVTEGDLGDTERQDDFRPNMTLPLKWDRVNPTDYSRSGYDRGHLCPSGDRSDDPQQNSLTFLMTNIAPQTADLNRYPWEKLESYARTLVRRGHVDLFVVAGVYGDKGKLKGKVTVPTNFWKVIIAVPQGGDTSAVDARSHVIAVDMPNSAGISRENWRKYITTVREIEQRTGYNFFSTLPQELRDQLETRTED